MTPDDLWGWQGEDADRLRREGKRKLADCWNEFEALIANVEQIRYAADLAQELDEPAWELFYRHWYLQQGLFRLFVNPQSLREVVDRLEHLLRQPACSELPQRFCARESIINVQQAIDAPGFAAETLKVVESIASEIPKALACHGCYALMRIQALLDLGRFDAAENRIASFLAEDHDVNQRFLGLLLAAESAGRRGDAAGMGARLRPAEGLVESGDVNLDNAWFLLELQVRQELLRDDFAGAKRRFEQARSAPDENSAESIRIALMFARAAAERRDWPEALLFAEDVAWRALRRGLVRLAAEGSLLAAETGRDSGDDAVRERHAAVLANLLPQLRSRDLDARAEAIGVVVPVAAMEK